jgi:hypothetical protein
VRGDSSPISSNSRGAQNSSCVSSSVRIALSLQYTCDAFNNTEPMQRAANFHAVRRSGARLTFDVHAQHAKWHKQLSVLMATWCCAMQVVGAGNHIPEFTVQQIASGHLHRHKAQLHVTGAGSDGRRPRWLHAEVKG